MSEYHLAFDQSAPAKAYQAPQQSVDWYQPSSNAYSDGNFSFDAPSTSAQDFGNPNSFEDEEPLLQELGIDLPAIVRRSRGVLLSRLKNNEMLSLDLGGPLVFAVLLASIHLLGGKLHFGVILGWNVIASIVAWFVANNLAASGGPPMHGLGLYDCCCLLGYCQVPLILHALLSLVLTRRQWRAGTGIVAVLWAGWSAAKLFSYRSPALKEQFWLVLYPCLLIFTAFVLLTLY